MKPQTAAMELVRRHTLGPLDELPQGLDAFFHALQGVWLRRPSLRLALTQDASRALQACEALSGTDDAELARRLAEARDWMSLDASEAKGHLVEVFGVIGQIAARTLGMHPYAVQFMGALSIQRGILAEMATGEGKTLTVGLAAVAAGLSGRTCHVITANDYLAQRDAEEMHQLYQACGLSVASMNTTLAPEERALRYRADVVYLTAKELLADHLRDEIGQGSREQLQRLAFEQWLQPDAAAPGASRMLVRGLHTAIVDEADSILIDEAVTPLILSAQRPSLGLADAVRIVSELADRLVEDSHYEAALRGRQVVLKEEAREALAALAERLPEHWRAAPRREELLRQALVVRRFFEPGKQYVVQDGEVVLLDEFTGRMTPGRTLTAGLHQAIEAHQGLEITDPNQSLTQMSFQTFFRRLRKLSGCTGTGWEAAGELWRVYRLRVVRIPTHRPRQTVYRDPVLVCDIAQKWERIAEEVAGECARGRAVLVGVRSVGASLALAERLQAAGCPAHVLNALEHASEAGIIARAGQPGSATIATNMAGRGTDIRLGQGVAELGGLHVIVAERNDSMRVDRQLAGRCGRQGDPGSVATYLCLDDELAQRQLPVQLRRVIALSARRWPRGVARLADWAFRWAQKRAEHEAFARRWSVLRQDDWMQSALPFEGRSRQ